MSSSNWLSILFGNLTTQLPILLASLAGVIVVLIRWQQARRAAPWALAGFGLTLALCVIVPVSQVILQQWVMQHGAAQYSSAFAVMSFGWAILRGASYVFLLVAIFAGRSMPSAVAQPPAAGV